MGKITDLSGRTIAGVLEVLHLSENQQGNSTRWMCRCKLCGREKEYVSRALIHRADEIKSCGCRKKESRSIEAATRAIMRSGAVPKQPPREWIDHEPGEIDKNGRPVPKLSEWERGRRDAIALGAGRWNFVNEVV